VVLSNLVYQQREAFLVSISIAARRIAMLKLHFLAILVCVSFATVGTAGPTDPVSLGLQLALIDYDAVHSVLIERCRSSSPTTVNTLTSAIANWKTKNDSAARQIRRLSMNNLMKTLKLSESEVTVQLARSSELVTAGLKNQFAQVPEDQLKLACDGQYAEQSLTSPSLDFNVLLTKLQAGNAYP